MSRSAPTVERAAPGPGDPRRVGPDLFTALLWVQGVYFFLTGVWPLVSIETFIAVTGPKTDHLITGREGDHWLVMTVGVLVTAVGVTLLVGAWRRRESFELIVLAVTSAIGLTAIDFIYVAREAIPPIYLADAAAELVLLGGWAAVVIRRSRVPRGEGS
jgi:hypothetical protein